MPQPDSNSPSSNHEAWRSSPKVDSRLKVGVYFWVLLLAWSAAVAGSLVWHFGQTDEFVRQAALIQARTAFEKDVLYRSWNARLSGVYAPVSEHTPPNPYLEVPEREIKTPSGAQLTKINPAYMTRQVHELGTLSTGVLGHITSLNPLRPENKPDAWEKMALKRFDTGAREISERRKIDGVDYLRLMKPLHVEGSCLSCHSKQGYKLGEIRGGISVSVPLAPFMESAGQSRFMLLMTHLALWLLGAVGLFVCIRLLSGRIAERHAMELELHRLATTDPLTGASNRGHLMERAEAEFQRSKRYKTPLSLLMLDIDHFKAINDKHGHQTGDQVLKQIAETTQAGMRKSDLFGRYGGEEFMALLTHTDGPGAVKVAENLLKMLGRLDMQTGNGPLSLTASIGVSQAKPDDLSLEDVVRRADEALYIAKQEGRNRVVLEKPSQPFSA